MRVKNGVIVRFTCSPRTRQNRWRIIMSTAVRSLPSTLDSAQRAFDHWCATRVQCAHTPIRFQRQAVALLSVHKPAHICAALKINDTALKRWEQSLRLSSSTQASRPLVSAEADNGFIRLPAERFIVSTARITESN